MLNLTQVIIQTTTSAFDVHLSEKIKYSGVALKCKGIYSNGIPLKLSVFEFVFKCVCIQ